MKRLVFVTWEEKEHSAKLIARRAFQLSGFGQNWEHGIVIVRVSLNTPNKCELIKEGLRIAGGGNITDAAGYAFEHPRSDDNALIRELRGPGEVLGMTRIFPILFTDIEIRAHQLCEALKRSLTPELSPSPT